MYPRVHVSGNPRERGRSYGEQVREQIGRTREGYESAFAELAGWSWPQAVEAAARYMGPIQKHAPEVSDELRGIAEGARLELGDVMAMNARTEVLWAATARQAAQERSALARECTAFTLSSGCTAAGYPLIAQNWDWLAHSSSTVVVLEVEQPGARPNYVTVVEAGLLAKASLNSAGVAVTTNALVTSDDLGQAGIPYHVMLRLLAECETVTDAIRLVQLAPRASSGNYLVASGDDVAVNLEAAPGDSSRVAWQLPREGVLIHTNHFLELPSGVHDVSVYAMPDSLVRFQRAAAMLADRDASWELESVAGLMADHADWPSSVCCHPDPRAVGTLPWATVMAVIMSPAERRLWLASGNPCEHAFEELDLGELLSERSSLRSSWRSSFHASDSGRVRART
jgi:isopenicillin-N N-acyltransferase like protein